MKTRISGKFELSYCTVWILCMGNAAENRCRKNALARFCMSRVLVFHRLVFTKISLILSGKAGDSRPQVLMGTVSVSMSSNFCSPRFCEACTERDLFRNGEVTCIQPGNLGALCQISKIRGFIDFIVDLIRILSKIDAFGNHLDHNIWFILVSCLFMPRVRCGLHGNQGAFHVFVCVAYVEGLQTWRWHALRRVSTLSQLPGGELCGKMSVSLLHLLRTSLASGFFPTSCSSIPFFSYTCVCSMYMNVIDICYVMSCYVMYVLYAMHGMYVVYVVYVSTYVCNVM